MSASLATALLGAWDPSSRAPAHARLSALLAAIGGETFAGDTLGMRNRRLLRLHRALAGGELLACVACPACMAQSEFAVPARAILATPAPEAEARACIGDGDGAVAFRLPCVGDIDAARRDVPEGVARAVLERCRLSGEAPLTDAIVEKAGRAFEAYDPAANVIATIECSKCARPIAASVDVATFVARDLDRLVSGLFRDVDLIASAYGWSESEIVRLPPERRRRYVAIIASARTPVRPRIAGRRA